MEFIALQKAFNLIRLHAINMCTYLSKVGLLYEDGTMKWDGVFSLGWVLGYIGHHHFCTLCI